MNHQKSKLLQNTVRSLAGLLVIPCLCVGSATPLAATEPTTQTHTAALDDLGESARAAEQTCEFFSSPQRYNTRRIGADGLEIEDGAGTAGTNEATNTTIVIGRQPNHPYKVIVPGDDTESLYILRTCILDAFISRARFGPYIHIGSFERRNQAERLRRILTREGYPARVIYQR